MLEKCPVDRECHPHHADTYVSMCVPEWWENDFLLILEIMSPKLLLSVVIEL